MPIVHPSPAARKTQPRTIQIAIEARSEEMCPITQLPIGESNLEFLESEKPALVPDRPELNAICLKQCNHVFSALPLVYHWVRNNTVLCPICRGGPKGAHLKRSWIPKPLRDKISRRVRVERRRDQMESVENDCQTAQTLARTMARTIVEIMTLDFSQMHLIFQWCAMHASACHVEFRSDTTMKVVYNMDCELTMETMSFTARLTSFELDQPSRMLFGHVNFNISAVCHPSRRVDRHGNASAENRNDEGAIGDRRVLSRATKDDNRPDCHDVASRPDLNQRRLEHEMR